MRRNHSLFKSFLDNRSYRYIALLLLFWILGCTEGVRLSSVCAESFSSLMRSSDFSSVSIVCAIAVAFLPLLVSYISVYFNLPLLLLPAAFIYASLFTFIGSGLYSHFMNAGWVVRWLMMFTSSCMSPVLLYFWIRSINGNREVLHKDMLYCSLCALLVCSVDCAIISPFTTDLFRCY